MWAAQTYAGKTGTKRNFVTEEAMQNRRVVAEVLLEAGADVNLETSVSIHRTSHIMCHGCIFFNAQNGWTPLMQASQDGDMEMVKILSRPEFHVDLDHESKVNP